MSAYRSTKRILSVPRSGCSPKAPKRTTSDMETGPWVCPFVRDDGTVCRGWGMTTEERRCHKCGAPKPFLAHDLMVGQARHARCGSSSPHAMKANRWATESGECHLTVHSGNIQGRKAQQQLRARFGLPVDEQDSYLHVWWAQSAAPESAGEAHHNEFLLCASAITAQVVYMRPPEQLADGAGKVELMLEFDSVPRTTHASIATQLAEHHHPTHKHGLLSMVVCFEALAALAPVLQLDSPGHEPNHRKLERWLVHIPPRLYTNHNRAWMMWALHSVIPCITVIWGLWQLYFNIEVFHQVVNDIVSLVTNLIEKIVGPVMQCVWHAFDGVEAWLVWLTEQFNVWLRPVKIVIQPVVTFTLAALAPLVRLGGTLCRAFYAPVQALVGGLQPVWTAVQSAGTAMAGVLQPLLATLQSVCSTMFQPIRMLFSAVQLAASVVADLARPVVTTLTGPFRRIGRLVSAKLPQILKLKPQEETKVLKGIIKNLVSPAQKVAKTVVVARTDRSSLLETAAEIEVAVEAEAEALGGVLEQVQAVTDAKLEESSESRRVRT